MFVVSKGKLFENVINASALMGCGNSPQTKLSSKKSFFIISIHWEQMYSTNMFWRQKRFFFFFSPFFRINSRMKTMLLNRQICLQDYFFTQKNIPCFFLRTILWAAPDAPIQTHPFTPPNRQIFLVRSSECKQFNRSFVKELVFDFIPLYAKMSLEK